MNEQIGNARRSFHLADELLPLVVICNQNQPFLWQPVVAAPDFHLTSIFASSPRNSQNGCLRALAQMNSSSSAATVPCRPLSSLPSGFHKRMEEDSCMEKRKERKDSLRVEEGLRYAIKSGP
ncbi:hypothetical protein QQP08_024843 [Theobroma cacao]|nr:hypothetical protein QQP08_024843 [Theobroma cacao]